MTSAPATLIAGAAGALREAVLATPLGAVRAVASPRGLRELVFVGGDAAGLPRDGGDPHLDALAEQLAAYFAGSRTAFDLALDPVGTPFELAVWAALREIPFGQTRSYGQLARSLGNPAAVRAVGRANGRNPLAIVVPCHRVIGAGGTLVGYAGGVERKRWLLDHEAGDAFLGVRAGGQGSPGARTAR